MLKIPKQCCTFGEYECQVPMPLNGRSHGIDICIADIVSALNASNIQTIASCCGHGSRDGIISLSDGRELTIKLHNEHSTVGDVELKYLLNNLMVSLKRWARGSFGNSDSPLWTDVGVACEIAEEALNKIKERGK